MEQDSDPSFLQQWREQCKRDLTNLLDTIRESTHSLTIVIEPDLVGALRTLFGESLSLLQTYGVEKMVLLTPDSWEYEDLGIGGTEYVVYIVRPIATWMHVIAGHVQQNARRTRTWPTMVAAAASSSSLVSRPLSYLDAKPLSVSEPTDLDIQVCDRVLEEEGVKGIIGVYEFALHLLPCGDVLSMEDDDAFKRIFVENDTSSLYYISRSLLQLQRMFGTITNIKGRGLHAQTVADLLLKFTRDEGQSRKRRDILMGDADDEEDGDENSATEDNGTKRDRHRSKASKEKGRRKGDDKAGKIDTLIILDRSLDLVTPLVTQFTYEGLLAEVMDLDFGTAEVDKDVIPPPEEGSEGAKGRERRGERAEHGRGGGRGRGRGRGGLLDRSQNGFGRGNGGNNEDELKVRISLYESGKLFNELRDVNFGTLHQVMQEKARSITPKYMKLKGTLRQNEKEGQLLDETELQSMLAEFASLQTEYESLQLHTNLADKVMQATRSPTFSARLQYEQRLVATGDVGRNPLLEQAMNGGEQLDKVLRLLCLASVVGGGLPPQAYDRYRKLLITKYGMQHICTLHNLEMAGLLVPVAGKQMFPKLRELLRLVVPEAQNGQPFDIAYTHSGYAPLSVRIVETAANEGWEGGELKKLNNVLGPVFEYTINEYGESVDGDGGRRDRRRDGRRDRSPRDRKKDEPKPRVALVFIIGGMTYAEAAALRLLSSRGPTQYLMGTTKLLGGSSFLTPLIELL